MGKIDDAHDAEDQRHADGHQEQHQPELHAVEKLLDQEGKRHEGSIFTAAMRGSVSLDQACAA